MAKQRVKTEEIRSETEVEIEEEELKPQRKLPDH